MENIEPMDILREPTPEEETLATILRWVKDSHDNKENKTTTIVFKKNTPPEDFKIIPTKYRSLCCNYRLYYQQAI
ncbi:hypothetical protein IMAU80627_00473 [Lactobacillus helveticus]|uniref:Uncharacterized protein n=1 Tax=Lactobacillus helveticus TaxID=1587 RepID=A0A386RGP0_LACHE|nr:hypothetical protein [Lactobacillus helveticus]AYE62184.1 hypothetical protein BC335_1790 [Lactobacillus helveticus]MCD9225502.1 hypothetical protein [Lactobacillus helveticus]NRN71947.1 hypothetical protein [Lactobacillus helveticus]